MSDDKDIAIDIVDSPDFGVVLICKDSNLADELEDFLTERCFVLFNIKVESDSVSIYFGQAGSVDRVRALYDKFVEQKNASGAFPQAR